MLPLPCLVLLLPCLPAAELPGGANTLLDRQLGDLVKAKDHPGVIRLLEGLPARERGRHAFQWLNALRRTEQWERLRGECVVALGDNAGRPGLLLTMASFLQGEALSRLGRHREALELYLRVGQGGDPNGHLLACHEATMLGDWKAQETAAGALVAKAPGNGEYQGLLGMAVAKQGRFAEAEVSLLESVRLRPEGAMAWADLACCRNERGAYAEAFEAATRALAAEPRLLEGLCNRGRACMGLTRYREGRDDYAAALALQPADPILVRNLKANITMADQYLAYRKPKAR